MHPKEQNAQMSFYGLMTVILYRPGAQDKHSVFELQEKQPSIDEPHEKQDPNPY